MHDSSKDPHWLTDQTSKDEIKNIIIWLNDWQKTLFFNENIQSLYKIGFLISQTLIFNIQFSLHICNQWVDAVLLSYHTLNSDDIIFWGNVIGVPV